MCSCYTERGQGASSRSNALIMFLGADCELRVVLLYCGEETHLCHSSCHEWTGKESIRTV